MIGGKKFDLRLYVLVRSYRPLLVYLYIDKYLTFLTLSYKVGFARFTSVTYTNDAEALENMFVHLTNVAIQKNADEYNEEHGGKWSLNNLLLYLASVKGKEASDKLKVDLKYVILQALLAVKVFIYSL